MTEHYRIIISEYRNGIKWEAIPRRDLSREDHPFVEDVGSLDDVAYELALHLESKRRLLLGESPELSYSIETDKSAFSYEEGLDIRRRIGAHIGEIITEEKLLPTEREIRDWLRDPRAMGERKQVEKVINTLRGERDRVRDMAYKGLRGKQELIDQIMRLLE